MTRLSIDKELLKDYLYNDNMDSLYRLIFEINGDSLKKIIAKMLDTTDPSTITECLVDFYDDLTKPTKAGGKKLRTFDFNFELPPYLKQSLRGYITDNFRAKQKTSALEQPIDDFSTLKTDDNVTEDYSECYESLLKALYKCESISLRDRYIMLTYLLSKIGNPSMSEVQINKSIAEQLSMKEDTVKKARQRAVEKLASAMEFKL
ncbi:MAG: hypothetical protein K2K26_03240 [Muribaculaceae bacterium]|nr:hypothetical protein [Muribaculaceae bacterium]